MLRVLRVFRRPAFDHAVADDYFSNLAELDLLCVALRSSATLRLYCFYSTL